MLLVRSMGLSLKSLCLYASTKRKQQQLVFYCSGDWMLWKARESCSMLEFWTLLESCCQDDWIVHYLLLVPSPLYQKWLYNFEPLTSERLKVKINSRTHHCEIFGARAITIITGFIEGLLLVHDVAVPMFLSLEPFELWLLWTQAWGAYLSLIYEVFVHLESFQIAKLNDLWEETGDELDEDHSWLMHNCHLNMRNI